MLTTDAFILHTHGISEADRIITAFTRDNGLMRVYARSVRKEGAKMRNAVKPYGCVCVSVVIGRRNTLKDITITDTLDAVWRDETKYMAFVTLLYNLRTFIPVIESRDENIFNTIETSVRFLGEMPSSCAGDILLVAQVMFFTVLGYIPDQTILPKHFEDILKGVSSSPERHKEFRRHLQGALQYQ